MAATRTVGAALPLRIPGSASPGPSPAASLPSEAVAVAGRDRPSGRADGPPGEAGDFVDVVMVHTPFTVPTAPASGAGAVATGPQ